ncbi:hypothetical protein RSOLAG1IB_08853 [Rhizoctonia solani AG-1 IB]|uniref:Uncharacterized protein n=1 Tax=Thanatephorus cucumeris (strain AG1-IB / isolate 7/3/14) TaxID=1108050 RepID=A0A0B7FPG2_THACB|nr:hypothetical protein RSOLAG1IB_08853 [Rhizoctonia solani AG-1 IB]
MEDKGQLLRRRGPRREQASPCHYVTFVRRSFERTLRAHSLSLCCFPPTTPPKYWVGIATRPASLPSRLGVPVSIPGSLTRPRRLPSLRHPFPVSHIPSLYLRRYRKYTHIPQLHPCGSRLTRLG